MKTIRLSIKDRPLPQCDSFQDEQSVRKYERQVREHRAYAEKFSVTALDGRVDGAFRVQGTGDSYLVDVVDGSGEHDTCSCPDFFTNDLGACKHIEAVRRALVSSRALGKAYAALPTSPQRPTVGVEARGGLSLVAIGKWPRSLLSRAGLVEQPGGALAPSSPSWPAAVPASVRVAHAALPAWERIRAAQALAQRSARLKKAIAQGRLGLDVLASPLFPYQREGVGHLVHAGRALLADDMGLGKTVQTIAACEVLAAQGEASRVLIVTPASLKDQWAREIEKLTGSRAVIVGGSGPARQAALAADARYKILNYELTWRELDRLQALDADVLVLDEAQRAKNFRTKTASTLRAIPSRFLFVLTGTPVENRLDDLYALMQLIDPTLLAPLWRFNLRYHEQNARGRIVGYKNLAMLRDTLSPVVMRRRKEDVVAQLPAITHQTRHTPLSPAQARMEQGYRQIAAQLLAIAERRALTRPEQEKLLAALLKARQACNAAELCDPQTPDPASPKLDELETIVEEIAAQGAAKVLVFSEWVEMLKLAAARLDKLGVGYRMLHGGVATERRPALLAGFRDDPDARVLLSSDAGGVGLNLQVATYVVHLDLPWNPARLDQRTARAHRVGQTRGVTAIYLCAETGIERGIEGTLAGKRSVRAAALDPDSDVDALEVPSFSAFLGQMRAVLGEMRAAQPPRPQGAPSTQESPPDTTAVPPLSLGPHDADGPEPAARLLPPDAAMVPDGITPTPQLAGAGGAGSPAPHGAHEPPADAPALQGPATQRAAFSNENLAPAPPRPSRAAGRLRFARVVLEAGFPADAARAAYDALAAAIAGRLDGPPPRDHGTLVAGIFRELLPSGRLPGAAHAALARLHDLAALEQHDVDVAPALAREALEEAESWVGRLTTPAA
jgi:superfamily II DNA or RNA helicase